MCRPLGLAPHSLPRILQILIVVLQKSTTTMVQSNHESRRKYWATRSSMSFLLVPLIHSLALHYLLHPRSLLRSFVCSLARSFTPELMGK